VTKEQERDYLLSVILSLDALAGAERLSNSSVREITRRVLEKIPPVYEVVELGD
jgi:hypothetical protein